jgi:hypothetical protein
METEKNVAFHYIIIIWPINVTNFSFCKKILNSNNLQTCHVQIGSSSRDAACSMNALFLMQFYYEKVDFIGRSVNIGKHRPRSFYFTHNLRNYRGTL